MPTKKVVSVSCTPVALPCRSSPTKGNAGTYMSVARGAIIVSNTTFASSDLLIREPRAARVGVPSSVLIDIEPSHVPAVMFGSLVLWKPGRPPSGSPACEVYRQGTPRWLLLPTSRRTVIGMDNRSEVREFLATRRAKLTPADVGLPDVGQRRVPGLRRGEVAALAGVSIEYYSKLERGSLAGVSASVLDAIARALRLDDAERSHLFDLARAADGTGQLLRPRRPNRQRWTPRPSLTWVLDSITGGPALVRNGRMDLLATNQLGRAMHASLYERCPGPVPNFA